MNKIMFIGQAMPRTRSHDFDWPSLNSWLYLIGVDDKYIKKNFYYSALVDYFPGAKNGTHVVPSKGEILKERERLKKEILDFGPDIVVPIGRLSIAHCLLKEVESLEKNVGKIYELDPYNLYGKAIKIIPLPHPSGASTWKYSSAGKVLLKLGLDLLKNNL